MFGNRVVTAICGHLGYKVFQRHIKFKLFIQNFKRYINTIIEIMKDFFILFGVFQVILLMNGWLFANGSPVAMLQHATSSQSIVFHQLQAAPAPVVPVTSKSLFAFLYSFVHFHNLIITFLLLISAPTPVVPSSGGNHVSYS